MRYRSTESILHEVDPKLKIISGGVRRRKRRKVENWEKGRGVECPKCRQETLRLIDGVCPNCNRESDRVRDESIEDREMRRYYRRELNKGTISVGQMREGKLADTR